MMGPTFQDVLVVDDDPAMRALLSSILKPAGFTVRTAADGSEALDSVLRQCPYFVITDWMMSPMNGIEFCRRLRQENLPHYVHIVLLTANTETDEIITGLNSGADDFIIKPVSKGELLARLQAGARVLKLENRLSQLAHCDSLTGVLNSRTLYQFLEREWSRAIRHAHHLSCVMIDVDFFKQTNDTYGHLAGDELLKALAQTIEGLCRHSDYVCRWGGDEFCVLLPETDEQGACAWAERCCSALLKSTFRAGSHKLPITASFGVAQRYKHMQNPERLIHLADQALLLAKKAGRRRVVTAWAGCLGQADSAMHVPGQE
jgi:diguanylate cyclase (GGDEF)-like protein